jgi:hypothetical protein
MFFLTPKEKNLQMLCISMFLWLATFVTRNETSAAAAVWNPTDVHVATCVCAASPVGCHGP